MSATVDETEVMSANVNACPASDTPIQVGIGFVYLYFYICHGITGYTFVLMWFGQVICHMCAGESMKRSVADNSTQDSLKGVPLLPAGNFEGVGGVVEIARASYGCRRGDRLQVVGESRKLWKLMGKKTIPKEHEGTGWAWVLEDEQASRLANGTAKQGTPSPTRPSPEANRRYGKLSKACVGGYVGYVIDGALDEHFIRSLDHTRLSLELDTTKKKTAAARRFFHDESGSVRAELEKVLANVLPHSSEVAARVLPWMRFLEYHEAEGALPPHTDALVRCKDTGRWSTHTLIVFTSDCSHGGDTVMLPSSTAGQNVACNCCNDMSTVGFAVRPTRGRIFCFPHQCPHEGRPTVVVPKILLRAEVVWTNAMCGR